MEIDFETLRRDLIDYYGTAATNGFTMAIIEISNIENASNEQLIKIAIQIGLDLDKYNNLNRR